MHLIGRRPLILAAVCLKDERGDIATASASGKTKKKKKKEEERRLTRRGASEREKSFYGQWQHHLPSLLLPLPLPLPLPVLARIFIINK